jgi:hypothetical protein
MPDINVNAKTMYEMSRKRMDEIQKRMDELHGELSELMEEHAALYVMAMAYEGPRPGEVIDMDGPPEKVTGKANIKMRREF